LGVVAGRFKLHGFFRFVRRAENASGYVNGYVNKKGFQVKTHEALNLLAGQEGFEPPALGFGVRCSNR
jgi:hypothetical protein